MIGVLLSGYSAYLSYTYLLKVKSDGLNVLQGWGQLKDFNDHLVVNFAGAAATLLALQVRPSWGGGRGRSEGKGRGEGREKGQGEGQRVRGEGGGCGRTTSGLSLIMSVTPASVGWLANGYVWAAALAGNISLLLLQPAAGNAIEVWILPWIQGEQRVMGGT